MSDISKCSNMECTLKGECFRYMVKSSHWQSYTHFTQEGGVCESYVPGGDCDGCKRVFRSEDLHHHFINLAPRQYCGECLRKSITEE